MRSGPKKTRSSARQFELEALLDRQAEYIARQQRIIRHLEHCGQSTLGARTILHLLEQKRTAILQELGYKQE